MKKKLISTSLKIISLFIFLYILLQIDIEQFKAIFQKADVKYFVFGYLSIYLLVLLKSIRWNLLMKQQKVSLPFFQSFYLYLWGFYYGVITPGRLGELAKVIYIRDKFSSFGSSVVSVIIDRVFDILVLLISAAIMIPANTANNLLPFFTLNVNTIFIISAVMLIGGGTVFFIIMRMEQCRDFIWKILKFIIPKSISRRLGKNLADFGREIFQRLKNPGSMLVPFILSVTSFLIRVFSAHMFILALNIPLDFFYTLFCITASTLVAILPISISGIGIREAAMVFLFSHAGLAKESAVIFSLLILSISVFLAINGGIVNLFIILRKRKE